MSSTTLKALQMTPGVIKDVTSYMAEGGWVDCDKIRFRSGRPEKIGGWVSETVQQAEDSTNTKFTGVARAALTWSSLDFKKFLAVGTHSKVELFTDNRIYDITPVRVNVSLNNKLNTTNLSPLVTIESTTHGLVVGDWIYVNSQASPIGGITLDGAYEVAEVVDSNNFKVDAGTNANATTSNGGGITDIDYLLSTGYISNGSLTGWSGGLWGEDGWGTPRSGGAGSTKLRQWSLDNWGEDLLACPQYGAIYHWDRTNGVTARLEKLATAPEENLFILVSQPSRHLIAFGSEIGAGPDAGTFDPLIIRWASQETLDDWDITDPLNTAGEFRLPKGNYIVGACQTRSEILVFTDTDVYSMRYVGGNDIFQFQPLGTNISAISPHSFIDVNGIIYWMGLDTFYMYDGVVRVMSCTITKHVFDNLNNTIINFDQKEKVYVGLDKEFHEVIWFYPRKDSDENGDYVKYNFLEQVWDFGTMERTVWVDKGTFEKPYAIKPDGTLYVHEIGNNDDSVPMQSFITTAYFDIDDGQKFSFLDRIVPDVRLATNKAITVTVYTKRYPHPQAEITTKGPYTFDDTDHKISLRARGRQVALKFESNVNDGDFEIGKIRVGFQTDGER